MFLFFLSFVAALFEYLGLVLIFQFVLFLSNPDTLYSEKITAFFNNNLNITDYQIISLILGISVAGIYIFKNIYMLVFTKINNHILEDLSVKITLKLIKHLIYGDYILVNSIPAGDKLDIINKVSIVVWQFCLKYITLITNIVIAFILILFLFVKFTACAVASFVLLGTLSGIEYFYLKKCSDFQNKNLTTALNNISSSLLKIISLFKEIKLYGKEEYFEKQSELNYKKYASLNKDKYFNDVFHIYFTEISIMLALMAILAVLFLTSNFSNQILITSISTISVIILRLTPVINRSQSAIYSINSHKKAALQILEFNKKFEKLKIDKTVEKIDFQHVIELKNVNFKYANNASGLKNINLKINKGDFIGIVGKSGCYKTTLALIISGLIKPDSGNITLDGKNLNEYRKWQNNIAFLNQNYGLLFENIYENILMGKEFDKNKIDKLLSELDIEDLKGISDVNLISEGQKQRIALASILYQDKDIIILDEATSSIDVVSEEKINNILKNLSGKKTIISIAHRLQILKYCTKIVYMDFGQIIDVDTFKNLENKYPEFKKITELSNFKSS